MIDFAIVVELLPLYRLCFLAQRGVDVDTDLDRCGSA
jgi:hypothetical protein